jgi:hypothetical protein
MPTPTRLRPVKSFLYKHCIGTLLAGRGPGVCLLGATGLAEGRERLLGIRKRDMTGYRPLHVRVTRGLAAAR